MRRAWRAAAVAAAVALAPAVAHADPGALRQGDAGRDTVVVVGAPQVSLGAWVRPRLGVFVNWRYPNRAIEVGLGTRRTLFRGARGGIVALQGQAGLVKPLLDPTAGLSLAPALLLGHSGERVRVVAGPVVPLAFSFGRRVDWRVPVLAELSLGVRLGPTMLGVAANTGVVFARGQRWSLDAQASLWLRVCWDGWRARSCPLP